MECSCCNEYHAIYTDLETTLRRLDTERFLYKMKLYQLEKQKQDYILQPTSDNKCCHDYSKVVIDTAVKVYMTLCEVEAYNALIKRRDPVHLAEKRNKELSKFKLQK